PRAPLPVMPLSVSVRLLPEPISDMAALAVPVELSWKLLTDKLAGLKFASLIVMAKLIGPLAVMAAEGAPMLTMAGLVPVTAALPDTEPLVALTLYTPAVAGGVNTPALLIEPADADHAIAG